MPVGDKFSCLDDDGDDGMEVLVLDQHCMPDICRLFFVDFYDWV